MTDRVVTLVVEELAYDRLSIKRLLPDGTLADPVLVFDQDEMREILGYKTEEN